MATGSDRAREPGCAQAARGLRLALLGFCALAVALLLIVYAFAPAIYVTTLLGTPRAGDAHPLEVTAFMLAILAFVGLLGVGIVRRWRWLFWLVLVAFSASVFQIPAAALALAGIVPNAAPAWYVVARGLVACVQVAIAVWMIRFYRRCGLAGWMA
jgi:hypothetical protein